MNLQKLLPVSLQDDFWKQFVEVMQEEIENFLTDQVKKKIDTMDVAALTDRGDSAQLLELAKMFGYTPDLSLKDEIGFIASEIQSIPFRVNQRSTPSSYKYIYNTIPWTGTVSLMYWNGTELIPTMNTSIAIESSPRGEPVMLPGSTVASFLEQELTIDFSPTLYLDSDEFPWALDQEFSRVTTSHLALMLIAETMVQDGGGRDLLVTEEYLEYILNAANLNRKVTDTPHPMLQVSALMDSSGTPEAVAALGMNSAVAPSFDYVGADFAEMVVGVGTHDLSGGFPSNVQDRIYTVPIGFDDRTTILDAGKEWSAVAKSIPGNTVNKEVIGTGDGATATFAGVTQHAPLIPGKVKIDYISAPNPYTVTDDKTGNLVGDKAVGTINYATGEFSITTTKSTTISETLHSGTELSTGTELEGVSQLNVSLANTPITPGSFQVSFSMGDGNNFYVLSDDGAGVIGAGSEGLSDVTPSTINYVSGVVELHFATSGDPDRKTDTGRDVSCQYTFTSSSTVDDGQDLIASYETESNLEITEAGLLDSDGNLVAYSTFAPVQLGATAYYLYMNFLIRQDTFGS